MQSVQLRSLAVAVFLLAVLSPYQYFWLKIYDNRIALQELLEKTQILQSNFLEVEEQLDLMALENDQLKEELKNVKKEKMIGSVIFSGQPEATKVVITIDDGWDAVLVKRALDYLKEEDVRATLFPVGSAVQANPEIWRRAVEEGHELGNHTYSHRFFTQLSESEILAELNRWQETLNRALGYRYPTLFFRPPGMDGFDGNSSNTAYYQSIIARNNLITVLWNLETCYTLYSKQGPRRAGNNPSAAQVSAFLVNEAVGGSIILLHFTAADIEALPALIRGLRDKGLEPVALTDLLFEGAIILPPREH
jgi:peptidoglycan/xylan/chitin deacetylase (PgdA/CDA1 family)